MVEIVTTCPFGSECETAIDGKLHRCRFYIEVGGENPQSGVRTKSWDCAIAWLPLMLVDNTKSNVGTKAAVEDMRNKMVEGQQQFNSILAEAAKNARIAKAD